MIDTSSLGSLAGKHLVGTDDESIGKIKDVYESTDGGGGTFATVTTGLFGGGASFFPLDAADLRGDDVVVPYSKAFIKDAPRVENDEELTAARGAAPVRVLLARRWLHRQRDDRDTDDRTTTTGTTHRCGNGCGDRRHDRRDDRGHDRPTAPTSTAPSATTPAARPPTTR